MNAIDVRRKTEVVANNSVIISTYTESKGKFPTRKSRLNCRTAVSTERDGNAGNAGAGYNRRAQLLAYTRELRNHPEKLSTLDRVTEEKKKGRRLIVPGRIRVLFDGMFRKNSKTWRYERVETDDYSKADGLCNSKRTGTRRNKAKTPFIRTFRCILRALSCGSRRKK